MTTITLRMDDNDKRELDQIVKEMGLTISTFYGIYTKRVLRDRRIPFDISAGDAEDIPYDKLKKGYEESVAGKGEPSDEVFDRLEKRYQ